MWSIYSCELCVNTRHDADTFTHSCPKLSFGGMIWKKWGHSRFWISFLSIKKYPQMYINRVYFDIFYFSCLYDIILAGHIILLHLWFLVVVQFRMYSAGYLCRLFGLMWWCLRAVLIYLTITKGVWVVCWPSCINLNNIVHTKVWAEVEEHTLAGWKQAKGSLRASKTLCLKAKLEVSTSEMFIIQLFQCDVRVGCAEVSL